ncbi:MAG: DUF6702 family protein [Saprospiraceae bacterium]
MKNSLCILIVLLFAYTGKAHQVDISTTMLVEKEAGTWILQITAALTAFEYEVHRHYSDTAYTTPKEFEELLVRHVRENLILDFNHEQEIIWQNALVKLGHETTVRFELSNVPTDIQTIAVKNASFKNIHRNQSALVLLKKGMTKKQFVLNNANEHKVSLQVEATNFVLQEARLSSIPFGDKAIYGLVTLLVSLLVWSGWKWSRNHFAW